jgi:hypothetical protein
MQIGWIAAIQCMAKELLAELAIKQVVVELVPEAP